MELNLKLHKAQGKAFSSTATEILYGGAAGGGKSHLFRVASIVYCAEIPGLQAYLFRRHLPDLEKNHLEGPTGYRALLAPWIIAGLVTIVEGEIRFWNGSKIWLCHCKDEKDVYKYLGAEIHLLLIDELTTFTEKIYRFLRARCRLGGLELPEKYKGLFPKILSGSNPGNVGHAWVKSTFVDYGLEAWQTPPDEGGMLRQFIPAKLSDNPSLVKNDPTYKERLSGLGSPELVKAMLEGDWGIIAGAFFPEFDKKKHVIRPRELPKHWMRYRVYDDGYADPFCCLWIAQSDGVEIGSDGRGIASDIPKGALVVYREYYGWNGKPNQGSRLTTEEIAREILRREQGEEITFGEADPSIFSHRGGLSVAEVFRREGVMWKPADNSRPPGFRQIRSRFKGDGVRPGVYIFDTCHHLIRTIPDMQHDEKNAEEMMDGLEDHPVDTFRYGCMARPYTETPKEPRPVGIMYDKDIEEIIRETEYNSYNRKRI